MMIFAVIGLGLVALVELVLLARKHWAYNKLRDAHYSLLELQFPDKDPTRDNG